MCITKEKWKKKKKTDLSSRQFSITAVVVNHHLFLHNIVAHGAIHFEYALFFSPFLLTSMWVYMKKAVVKASLYLLSKECCSCFYDNKACIYIETKRKGHHPLTRKRKTHISFLVAWTFRWGCHKRQQMRHARRLQRSPNVIHVQRRARRASRLALRVCQTRKIQQWDGGTLVQCNAGIARHRHPIRESPVYDSIHLPSSQTSRLDRAGWCFRRRWICGRRDTCSVDVGRRGEVGRRDVHASIAFNGKGRRGRRRRYDWSCAHNTNILLFQNVFKLSICVLYVCVFFPPQCTVDV